jgi:ubiquinone biosynthesis protein UbiJ
MAPLSFSWIGQLALPRLTLLLNHIVSSEPVAMAKLKPHAGRTVDFHWVSSFQPPLPDFLAKAAQTGEGLSPWRFVITPAGLFEAVEGVAGRPTDAFATASNFGSNPGASPGASPATASSANGLTITVHLPDPFTLAKLALKGERPEVNIEGDAALAEVASWMMKNLRWDVQDDLARWMGTAPAELLRTLGASVRQSLQRWRPSGGGQNRPGAHGHDGHRH